jgi:hypothetical protein
VETERTNRPNTTGDDAGVDPASRMEQRIVDRAESHRRLASRRSFLGSAAAGAAAGLTAGVAGGVVLGQSSQLPPQEPSGLRRFENKVVLITGATSGIRPGRRDRVCSRRRTAHA